MGIQGKEVSPQEAIRILEERRKEGLQPRPSRRGVFGRYTRNALSAMEGAGYED